MTEFLRFEKLSKNFQEGDRSRVVLRDAELTLHAGEIVAILGKSGSGKTTLLNLVGGLDAPDAGSVFFDGRDLAALSERERTLLRRRRMGFIFQFFNLLPTLTVWENLTLPLELNGQSTPADLARAESLLAQVGLTDRRNTYPDRLSGGEQQRVAIARALAHDPALLLADEPTGNLDEETGRKVLALLENLARRDGKGMLLVTHSAEAAAIADRVYTLREGRLIAAPIADDEAPPAHAAHAAHSPTNGKSHERPQSL